MNRACQRKILEPAALAHTLRALRTAGRRVVQCHGCFDIVHPGHIRYLQSARELGDVLVVTLTGDAQISKGPDRPYIPQELRAESLAALEFVDFVAIDPHPTAVELLELLRPDVYVKGGEYATAADRRFLLERETVERCGGRVVFHSGDVVFSSTRLLERMRGDEHLDAQRLRALCRRHAIDAAAIERTLSALSGLPVLVVGDAIAERCVHCDASELADDAPVPALRQLAQVEGWGGAAAVALQLEALGARPTLVSTAANDADSAALRDLCDAHGVPHHLPVLRPALPRRTTFLADDAKLIQVLDAPAAPLDSAAERELLGVLTSRLPTARALVWCDHGYGALTPGLIQGAGCAARQTGATVAGHAIGSCAALIGLTGTNVLTASERQLRQALHDMHSGVSSVAWRLLHQTGGQCLIVSMRKRGLVAFDGRTPHDASGAPDRLRSEFVQTFAPRPLDLAGADEALLATAAAATAAGASLLLATYVAAAVEALAVNQAGRVAVTLDDLRRWLTGRPELAEESRFVAEAPFAVDRSRAADALVESPLDARAIASGSHR